MARSRILLLQGMAGPFFGQLQKYLNAHGYDAWRVCFHGADELFCSNEKRIRFSGSADEWQAWLKAFMKANGIHQIILFGAERKIHVIARKIAQQASVRVLCLEEGHIRPNFITVEPDGNNANSPLAGQLPPEEFSANNTNAASQARLGNLCVTGFYAAAYYSARTLRSTSSQSLLFHKHFSALPEAFYSLRNGYRRLIHQGRETRLVKRLITEHCKAYFLVPLQVPDDTQMAPVALGWNAPQLISEVPSSFARSAPSSHRLVFNIHPIRCGHSNERRLISETARAFNIDHRVDVIDTGCLAQLTHHAAGMITINSTSGFSAIFHGVPLLVIGNALYAHDALATCARGNPDFDAFWHCNHVADADVRRRYLAWIRQNCLKPGDDLVINIWEASGDGLFSTAETKQTEIRALIDQDGKIFVPYVGEIRAAGLSMEEIRATIEDDLRGKAIEPQVQISLVVNGGHKVTITGDVASPGRHNIPISGLRLLEGIALAGGARQAIFETEVTVIRGNARSTIRLDDVFKRSSNNVWLMQRDTEIAHRPRSFSAFGAVTSKNHLPFETEELSLVEALARSGGLNDNRADAGGVFVFRFEDTALVERLTSRQRGDGGAPIVYRLNFKEPEAFFLAQSFKMRDKDVIYVANHPTAELGKFLSTIVSPLIGTARSTQGLTN